MARRPGYDDQKWQDNRTGKHNDWLTTNTVSVNLFYRCICRKEQNTRFGGGGGGSAAAADAADAAAVASTAAAVAAAAASAKYCYYALLLLLLLL